MDLNRLTVRARGALEGAHQQAVARNHQQIEPVHVLFALLGDPEGIVYPVLHALGVQPKTMRDHVDADARPHPEGVRAGRSSRGSRRSPTRMLDRRRHRGRVADRRVHLDRAPAARDRGRRRRSGLAHPAGGRPHARHLCCRRSPRSAGSQRVTDQNPEEKYQASGAVRPRPHRATARAASSTR